MEVLPMSGSDNPVRPPDPGGVGDPVAGSSEPRVVAGFRLLRRVGEGGMSTVFLSYDVPGRRAVAVKLLADHLSGQQEFVNRFYREARLSRVLHHPNIIQGYAAGYDPDANKHYIVLEFIDGPSAHAALTRLGRLPVGVAVKIGIDIARALTFLHGRNYVHRDVKPDNILLHPDGSAKLADLGLAKRLSDDMHLTSVNQGVGTSYYMPYEQAMNAALVDGRSDIFALGATLYHLLTGVVPFAGSTHEEIIREKEHDSFVRVRSLNPDVPEELDAIVASMLARNPRERFQDAAALGAVLEASGLATPIPSFAPAGHGLPAGPETPPTDSPTRADLPRGTPPDEVPGASPRVSTHTPAPNDRLPGDPPPPGTIRLAPAILSVLLAAFGAYGVVLWAAKPAVALNPPETVGSGHPPAPPRESQ
jgi:serine/threonine-protein kinase